MKPLKQAALPKRSKTSLAIAATLTVILQPLLPAHASDTVINGSYSAQQIWSSDNFTVTSGSSITSSTSNGVVTSPGVAVGTLVNQGVISGPQQAVLIGGTSGSNSTADAIININGASLISSGITSTAVIKVGDGTLGSLSNTGLISGWRRGIDNEQYIGTIFNNDGGTIYNSSNRGQAIANNGTIGMIENGGVLKVDSTSSNTDGPSGVAAASNPMGIANYQTIGFINNTGTGLITISGTSATGIYSSGTIGTIFNSGRILVNGAASAGINNDGGSISILSNLGGTISAAGANANGVYNRGTIASLTNTGIISATGTGSRGVYLTGSGHLEQLNNNGGTIAGDGYGVYLNSTSSLATLTNSGLISGGIALDIAGGATLGTLLNSGLIAGSIVNLSSQALSISGGSGTVFGTLTGASGSIGSISNAQSNLVFTGGNLLLNDNISVGSNTVINAGATLQVNQPVTISGNYNQTGGTLQIGAVTSSQSGALVVTNNTSMTGGTVNIVSAGYALANGQRYLVVDTAGSASYSGLTYSASGFTATGSTTIVGSHTDLIVTLGSTTGTTSPTSPTTTSSPSSSGATVPNAQSALGALGNYTGVNVDLMNLNNAVLALQSSGSIAELNKAGKQLSPTSQTNSSRAASAPTFDMLNIVSSHSDGLRLSQGKDGSGVATGENTAGWNAWGQAFGGRTHQGERDQIDGYRATFGGLLLGADHQISERWHIGGLFSYSNTAVDNSGDTSGNSTRVNAYGLIGYASYVADAWYANLSSGVIQQRYNTNRQLSFTGASGSASGSFSGQQYVSHAEVGYPLVYDKVTVTPIAGLTYSYLHQNGYTESGSEELVVNSSHTTSVTSDLGAKFEHEVASGWGALIPDLRVSWRHEFDKSRSVSTSSLAVSPGSDSFSTAGASPQADLAVLSTGLTLMRSDKLSVTARYEVQLGAGYFSQAGSLRLRKEF